jgi:hypothetical protein
MFVLGAFASIWANALPADAAVTHPFSFSFNGSETPAGSLVQAGSVAVSRQSENVYVADIGSNVADVFTASGKYESQITGTETPAGAFNFTAPAAIAIDNSTNPEDLSAGDVYVIDSGNNVIDKFSSTGAYLGQVEGLFGGGLLGLGVDGSGNLWVYTGESNILEFDDTGTFLSKFSTASFPEPPFAVDTSGHTYPSTFGGVQKFNAHGEVEGTVDSCHSCQTAVATDFANDDVYSDDQTVVKEIDSSQHPLGEFGETQLTSGGPGGMSVAPISGEIYVANATDAKVNVFLPAPGPRALATPATGIQVSSATLHAAVVPNGAETTYEFEYGPTTEYGQTAPLAPGNAGSGTAPVAVEAEAKGLEGSTTYHYRIVAQNGQGIFRSADRTFVTSPIPGIESAAATNISGTSARLNAVVNTRGLAGTTYRFEWGTDASYGNGAPVPDGTIAGTGQAEVSQLITGLTPGVTVHWRIVVTSSNGVVAGSDHTFVYNVKEHSLPDGRQYEMVSPTKKNGALLGDTFIVGGAATISADGSRVITETLQCFAGAEGCTAVRGRSGTPVSFTRSSSGWLTTPLAESATQFERVSYWKYGATEGDVLFSAPNNATHEDDYYLREASGAVREIGPLTPPAEGALGAEAEAVYGSTGMNRIIWISQAPKWPFDGTTGRGTVYEEIAGATRPNLVAVSGGRESTELLDVCGTVESPPPNALSEDGGTYFMQISACAEGGTGSNAGVAIPVQEILARRAGEETIPLSEAESDPACTSAECLSNTGSGHGAQFRNAEFAGASGDGKHAFFVSTQQLTNGATQDEQVSDSASTPGCGATTGTGCNLYEFECASCSKPSERSLIDVSGGDSSGGGPRVRGVTAVAADGSHVYFVAEGVLTNTPNAAGQLPKSGRDNLYVYERDAAHPAGAVAFIATYESTDSPEWLSVGSHAVNVTPDGRYLVFMSSGRLTPDDTSKSGALQVFRFDDETRQLVRISTGEDGYDDDGNRSSTTPCQPGFCSEDARIAPGLGFEQLSHPRLDPTMSDDGSFVFFQSPVGLAPGALNDAQIGVNAQGNPVYALNVYEWHDGQVSLLSDGHDVSADTGQSAVCNVLSSVCLLGTNSSGSDVFFTTTDSLVPQDTDTELDYYDARICTTSEPCVSKAGAVAECDGESCHGQGSSPPSLPTAASVTFSGAGNAPAPPTATIGKVKVVRHVVQGAKFALTVAAPAVGTIRVSGPKVVTVNKAVSHGGNLKVSVALSRKARLALRRAGKRGMEIRVQVTFTTKQGVRSVAAVSFLVRR